MLNLVVHEVATGFKGLKQANSVLANLYLLKVNEIILKYFEAYRCIFLLWFIFGRCPYLRLSIKTMYNIIATISRSLSPRHDSSSGCGWRNGLRIWRVAANTLNKQSRTAGKG
jgi:hypothetical protein